MQTTVRTVIAAKVCGGDSCSAVDPPQNAIFGPVTGADVDRIDELAREAGWSVQSGNVPGSTIDLCPHCARLKRLA